MSKYQDSIEFVKSVITTYYEHNDNNVKTALKNIEPLQKLIDLRTPKKLLQNVKCSQHGTIHNNVCPTCGIEDVDTYSNYCQEEECGQRLEVTNE